MRHLRVPNNSVQDVIVLLKGNALHSETMRIFPDSDGKHRLIPLSEQAPQILPDSLDGYQVVIVDGVPYGDESADWWEHLRELVGEENISLHGESWPSNHEFIGDMMIVRIEDGVSPFRSEIAYSKMTAHPRVRILMEDRGVQGEFRIRDLVPIALREDKELIIGDIPEEKIDTRVMVRESGKMILCDPTKAYFSTKLQTERIETLNMARRLRKLLDRPIRVCDPFCGVGPALANIITEESLVSDVLAADLNPEAISMLLDNLRRWDGRKYPEAPSPIERVFPDRIIGVADATELSSVPEMRNSWDMLCGKPAPQDNRDAPQPGTPTGQRIPISHQREGNCRRIRNRGNYRENRRNRIPPASRPTICQPQSEEGLQQHPETLLFRGMDRHGPEQ